MDGDPAGQVVTFRAQTVTLDVEAGTGLPAVTEYGPWFTSEVTKGLPGNAACNCCKPVGVGNRVEDNEGDAPLMVLRNRVLPNPKSLSLRIGPPNDPPHSLPT